MGNRSGDNATTLVLEKLRAIYDRGGAEAGETFHLDAAYALVKELPAWVIVPDDIEASIRCAIQTHRAGNTKSQGGGYWRFLIPTTKAAKPQEGEKQMIDILNGVGTSVSDSAERITSKYAKEVLAFQEAHGWTNRKIAPGMVKENIRHMRAGTFEKNTTIQFAKSGRLLDGWHRMTAAAQGDVDFYATIIKNVPETAHVHIDIGTKRTLAHKLTFEGLVSAAKAAATTSALNTLDMYIDQAKGRVGVAAGPALARTNGLNLESAKVLFDQHPDLRASVDYVGTKSQTMSVAIMTTVHYLIARIAGRQREANQFIDSLKSGALLPHNSPILALRRLVLEGKPAKITGFGERLWMTVEAANLFLLDDTVRGGAFAKKDIEDIGPRVLIGADPKQMRRAYPNLMKPTPVNTKAGDKATKASSTDDARSTA